MNIEISRADRRDDETPGRDLFWHPSSAARRCREEQFGHRPATLWLTGLSGSGKSTIAYALEAMLLADGHACCVLDGDSLRQRLNRDLGCSAHERREHIRRSAEVARLMNDAGLIVLASFISPLREDRALARAIVGDPCFVEVHVSTPLEVCAARDPKGLYASAPYEPPADPDVVLDACCQPAHEAANLLYRHVAQRFL